MIGYELDIIGLLIFICLVFWFRAIIFKSDYDEIFKMYIYYKNENMKCDHPYKDVTIDEHSWRQEERGKPYCSKCKTHLD